MKEGDNAGLGGNEGVASGAQGAPDANSGVPAQGVGNAQQEPAQSAKSSTTAGLLGIFLGAFGVHDFYLGYKQLGIIHACLGGGGFILTLVGAFLPVFLLGASGLSGLAVSVMYAPIIGGLGSMAMTGSGIWGFVEGIMCFTKSGKYSRDASGMPLA